MERAGDDFKSIKMIRKNMRKNNFKKGFTLTEIVVVLGILGLIMLSITSFQKDVLVNNRFSSDSLTTIENARPIMRHIIRSLRSAASSDNGSYAIAQAATNTITFFSDADLDGLKEQIRYFVQGTDLKMGYVKPTGSPLTYNQANEVITVIANSVKNATSTGLFEYYDKNYTGTTSPMTLPINVTSVRLIKVNLMIDIDPSRSPVPRIYTSQVNLRNLKDNL